jgi:Fe-S cluster assembly scaffold protein SufB
MKLQGTIVAINWVGSTIVVRDIQTTDQITFLVTRETRVTKGMHTISLSDLNVQDRVTIEYCDVHLVGLKALSVTVNI